MTDTNPHSDLPFGLQPTVPPGGINFVEPTGREETLERFSGLNPDLIPGGERFVGVPSVLVVTHIDSLGIVQKQHAVSTHEKLRKLMRQKYKDFSAEDDEPVGLGKQKVYTCCFDHIVVANLVID